MERNLDKRIEVGCPILDPIIQKELDLIFDYQWKGNNKARLIDPQQKNAYRTKTNESWHSQMELYEHYRLMVSD
jgi:polyphosphate kinase